MQIFFLSDELMIALCLILWLVFQLSAVVICLKMPDRYFSPDRFLYRGHKWEVNGIFYEKVLKIRKWKHLLPDGGAIVKSGFSKKHLTDHSKENLERFQTETCRAELTHFLAILPFWIFGLFTPPIVILFMFIYAVAVNMPCIITQRYNRIRLARVLKKHYT
ncbi:MAG: glycosyl-4,4'-diaponeurosporenoate acyltransferase [Clostridia bacterium]